MRSFRAKGAVARSVTWPGEGLTGPVKQRGTALLFLLSVVVGGGGMIGQLLLLRELFVSFYGNEISMGVVLANWLLMEAAGALAAGRRADTLRRPLHLYLFLLILYAVFLPAALYCSRGAQYLFFGFLPGEAVGTAPIFLASLLLVAPPAFIHGALFPLSCRLLSPLLGERISTGKIYLYETMGTLTGGALFSLFLAGLYHSLGLALAISLLHLSGCFFLLSYFPREARLHFPLSSNKCRILQAAVLTTALLLLLFFTQAGNYLHIRSLERQWGDQEVVHYANSPYGKIVAVHSGGEYTFFYNGRPVITIPAPDKAIIGDYVHIAAAAHSRPRSVLLLAGGPGGFLDELLKHPVQEVTYVDLDPYLPAAVTRFATPLVEREFQDPRVAVKYLDGRLFLDRTEHRFDLMMLGFVTPETLQTNRFYTGEFFSLAGRRLDVGGILAFSAPGSPVLMSPEMLALNAVLYHTLRRHFANVHVIPGVRNIFLASAAPLDIDAAVLDKRLEARGLAGEFVAGNYLHYRLDEERARCLREKLTAREVRLNSDLNPAGFYYALRYWGEAFSPGTLTLLRALEWLKLQHFLLAVLALTV
ncbi:MAG TPA: hypothetical protein DCQ14_02865, partial [Firmicutes bacterium]|nr:hypothetical protein [Bacillota bacterium]